MSAAAIESTRPGAVSPHPNKPSASGIRIARERDAKLTPFGKAMLSDSYLLPGESFQDRFSVVAAAYGDDQAHAQRIYDYISNLWFMPATPVLSNGGTTRGLPISCFLNEADDSLESIVDLWNENVWLAAKGGGIGSYWGNLRSIGEKAGQNGKTSGIIPFIKVMDSQTLAISQGSLRRGSAAVYLPVSHPEIEEFVEMRRVTGGDPNRKALNLHHGIAIPDAFMQAVKDGSEWALRSPKDNSVVRMVSARDLWIRILTARIEQGEPYLLFIDTVNRLIPEHHKRAGLKVKTSNLCSEITLPTGRDHLGQRRTAVCCLSSLNLEMWDEWKDHPTFIEDVMRFLDNVLDDFIARAPSERRASEEKLVGPILQHLKQTLGEGELYEEAAKAVRDQADGYFRGLMDSAIYAAKRERSVGLGVMGFHSFLQLKGVPFESQVARIWNKRMFKHIQQGVNTASRVLAEEKGACPDAAEQGFMERFSNKTAIAPTASISVIAGQSSAGIEPYPANAYTEKRKNGSFEVHNKHLRAVLAGYGRDNPATWSSIMTQKGSVQHLDFLSPQEKAVFKTAFELDQMMVVQHAADRSEMIDQAQSVNVFLPGDVHKQVLHNVHMSAWEKGVKSLYYCRSLAVHRAQNVSEGAQLTSTTFQGSKPAAPAPTYEVCESCQ